MLATSPNVGLSLGLSQTQAKVRFMKPSSARQPSAAVRSKPHFSWLDEDCESRVSPSSCFFVLGSIDILIFAQKKINVWPPKSKVLSMTRLPLIYFFHDTFWKMVVLILYSKYYSSSTSGSRWTILLLGKFKNYKNQKSQLNFVRWASLWVEVGDFDDWSFFYSFDSQLSLVYNTLHTQHINNASHINIILWMRTILWKTYIVIYLHAQKYPNMRNFIFRELTMYSRSFKSHSDMEKRFGKFMFFRMRAERLYNLIGIN